MTDQITRARKEWVEDLTESQWEARGYVLGCPPEVVAALLDLRAAISTPTIDDPRLSYVEVQIERDDLLAVDRAIAHALEGKP
jgi:hypothetical protein